MKSKKLCALALSSLLASGTAGCSVNNYGYTPQREAELANYTEYTNTERNTRTIPELNSENYSSDEKFIRKDRNLFERIFCLNTPEYTDGQKFWTGVLIAGQAGDALSTMHALDNGAREANPLLGRNASKSDVALFKILFTGATLYAGHCLAPEHRSLIYGTVGTIGLGLTGWNLSR